MKKLLLLFVVSIFAIITTACGNDASTGSKETKTSGSKTKLESKDTLVIGLDDDPPQLDPHMSSAAVDRQTFQSLYNKLVDVDENLDIIPELAKEWKITDEGKTYTFKLQENVVFHDGTPFNAEAVKFNFERMLDPDMGSPRKSEIASVSEVNVKGDYEIEIKLKEPYAPFLAALTDRAGMMVSPTAVKESGKDFANKPVGTGPYQLEERVTQSHINLTRFEDYWREEPKIKKIVIKPFSDADVRVTNLVSGDLDIINKVAYKDLEDLRNNENITLLEKDSLMFQGIQLNTKVAPFDNKKVRQALNYAIDREAITKVVFHGGAVPAISAFPSSSWASPDMEVPKVDVEKAKALLKESGVGKVSFTLKITPKPEEQQIAQMLQSMLKAADIDMEIEMVEFGTLLEQQDNGEFTALRLGWSGRTDPDGNIYSWFYTDAPLNKSFYSDAKVDELLTNARINSDQEERAKLYKEVSEILFEDAPYIFLYHEKDYKAMKKNVKGFNHISDTMIRTETMYFE
ncbi:ABC transporter substrate-binding protein [Bacillus sp. FJAT-49732]|uniref:ABC transporter substrate-binding protein n=1 Tax=Lederbergia citrisecunda TaxID=2833583 RepID=A0A942TS89_9BACI|nr:ABC transporter substrate-binding protein [Lederbergia citrisecunda]MBS4201294.1 ABC transporter substrate-binding protein [Lederbergia citrisecunda]